MEVMRLKAELVRVIFHNDTYFVCVYATDEDIPDKACTRIGIDAETNKWVRQFIGVGHGLLDKPGRNYALSGDWEVNKKRGTTQLHVLDCADFVPPTKEAIVAYLSSSVIKGVGPKIAERIYEKFKEETLDILENDPRRLLEVAGITESRLADIIDSFEKHQEMHILARLLTPYNVSYRMIVRVHQTLGENAAQQIRANPYVLCNVTGIGFQRADTIAMRMGIVGNAPARVDGGIIYTFQEQMSSYGHVFLTRASIHRGCIGKNGVLLCGLQEVESVTEEDVDAGIERLCSCDHLLIVGNDKKSAADEIYMKSFFVCEIFGASSVAQRLVSAEEGVADISEEQLDGHIVECENMFGLELADMQRAAVKKALLHPFCIITGGPGSGKTTILRFVTQIYKEMNPASKILLAAPTGRAARRMKEQTGAEASTIHHMLGLKPNTRTDFTRPPDQSEYLDADFIIIDESSMIDAYLFAELMYRVRLKTKLLFIGDVDQLPSVGPGNVLRELLSIPSQVPSVRLNKVYRQSGDSIIPHNAAQIRAGDANLTFVNGQFSMLLCQDEEAGAEKITQLARRLIELGQWENTQILCPMRKRGAAGTENINRILQDVVNPPQPFKAEETVGGCRFRVGDRVIQNKNTECVSNGDMGTIISITPITDGDTSTFRMRIAFDCITEETVEYNYDQALDVDPADAITIHKSQGGEFDIVIVPVFSSMTFFLRRNLIYTAVTRAKKHVVLVTDETSLGTAIRREDMGKRNTNLRILIKGSANEIKENK